MSSDAALERARRLIELTASSNEHEAKTAALLACRIIREHKIELSLPASSRGEGAFSHETDTSGDLLRDGLDVLFGRGKR